MSDLKEAVKQALAEGANPRGFSPELAEAHAELVKEAEEANKKAAKQK
jgi:hypothetical protein